MLKSKHMDKRFYSENIYASDLLLVVSSRVFSRAFHSTAVL